MIESELASHKPVTRQQRRVKHKLTGEELYKKMTNSAVEGWGVGVNQVLRLLPDVLNEELGVGKKRYERVEENLISKLSEMYRKD